MNHSDDLPEDGSLNELGIRTGDYIEYFQDFRSKLFGKELWSFIAIDETKLTLALGYYFRDRARIKAEHQLKKMHRSKVAAYTMHWLIHFCPIYNCLSREDLSRYPLEVQNNFVRANYYFPIYLLFQILDEEISPLDFHKGGKYERVMDDLVFHLFRNSFNPEIASVLFATLAAGASPKKTHEEPPLGI